MRCGRGTCLRRTGTGGKEFALARWSNTEAEVKALHVMLLPDGSGWFAQGLEIDYAASGKTLEQATNHFIEGLGMTLCENLVMYGHIKKVLMPASQEAWNEYYESPPKGERYSVSFAAAIKEHEEKPVNTDGPVPTWWRKMWWWLRWRLTGRKVLLWRAELRYGVVNSGWVCRVSSAGPESPTTPTSGST